MHVDPEFDPLVSVPQEFTLGPSIPLLTQALEQGCGEGVSQVRLEDGN